MSKQKTPLAEAFEFFEKHYDKTPRIALLFPIYEVKKKELLAKEREAIINAAEEGYHQESSSKIDGERYFNENFQQ